MTEKNTLVQFVTPPGRVIWPSLFKPVKKFEAQPGDPLIYRVTLFWPKADKEALLPLFTALKQARNLFFGDSPPANLSSPIRDGDNPEHNTREIEALFGQYYMTLSKKEDGPFAVLDPLKAPAKPTDVYSGCYGRASGIFGGFSKSSKVRGVFVRMSNFQVLGHGEPIATGADAADQFPDDEAAKKYASAKPSQQFDDDDGIPF